MDNMFGLGISISLEDLASNGLRDLSSTFTDVQNNGQTMAENLSRSFQVLQNLSVSGMAMTQMGNSLYSTGMSGIGVLRKLGEEVIHTGSTFETMRQTMGALYGDAQKGAEKTQWAMNLAAKTPFQMEDLTNMMIRMKSIDVEADKMYTDQKGRMQSLAQYIGDLAALHPEKGLQMTTQFIQELLELSPRGTMAMRSLGVSTEALMKAGAGDKWGKTTEERIQQLVKVSAYMANGLSSQLMGTWKGITSNIEDQIDRVKLAIADSGAFDAVKKTLMSISDCIGGLTDDKLKKLGATFAGAFTMIWQPIDFVVKGIIKLVTAIESLSETNPMLAKLVLGFVAISSAMLVTTGLFFKLTGGIMMTIGSFGTFLLLVKQFGGLSTIFTGLGASIRAVAMSFLPMIATVGAIYLAYRTNFLGIRDMLQNFMNNCYTAFTYSAKISDMNAKDMGKSLDTLRNKFYNGDLWAGLTLGLVKLRVLWTGLCDAWSDNVLSDENFKKAKEAGVLPLIEGILRLKLRAEEFFVGFKLGWNEASTVVKTAIEGVLIIVGTLVGHFTKFLSTLGLVKEHSDKLNASIDVNKWQTFGEVVGWAVVALGGLFILNKIRTMIAGVTSALSILTAHPIVFTITALTLGVIGLYKNCEPFRQFVDNIISKLGTLAENMKTGIIQKAKDLGDTLGKLKDDIIKGVNDKVDDFKKKINDCKEALKKHEDQIKSVAKVLGVIFGPALIKTGVEATIAGGKIAGQFIMNIIRVGSEAVINGAKLTASFIANIIRTGAEAIVAGTKLTVSFIGAIIKTGAQAVIAGWKLALNLTKTIVTLGIEAVVTAGKLTVSLVGSLLKLALQAVATGIKIAVNLIGALVAYAIQGWSTVAVIGAQTLAWATQKAGIMAHIVVLGLQKVALGASAIAMGVVTAAQWAWNVAMNANPIGLIITAIGALILIIVECATHWTQIKEKAKECIDAVLGWVGKLASAVGGVVDKLKSLFGFGGKSANISVTGDKGDGKMVGLATGGYVSTTGIAMLHPNEVVVNDETTTMLKTFLKGTKEGKVTPSSLSKVSNNRGGSVDQSVTIEKGAIVIQSSGNLDADSDKLIAMIEKKLQRRQQLRNMANYKPI